MVDQLSHEPARDPQDLERLLISRQQAGDVEGMVALYEEEAVLHADDGELRKGKKEIRAFFAEQVASGKKYDFGNQRPAIVTEDLALTSTLLPGGAVTAEVARRQVDGTWLWIIDKFSVE